LHSQPSISPHRDRANRTREAIATKTFYLIRLSPMVANWAIMMLSHGCRVCTMERKQPVGAQFYIVDQLRKANGRDAAVLRRVAL
jgi:hypothetical protein